MKIIGFLFLEESLKMVLKKYELILEKKIWAVQGPIRAKTLEQPGNERLAHSWRWNLGA